MCDVPGGNNLCQSTSCAFTWCGDGIKQTPNGYGQSEGCDAGSANANSGSAACSTSCTVRTWCGDGAIQTPNSNGVTEQCDGGTGCLSNCTWNIPDIVAMDFNLNGTCEVYLANPTPSTETITVTGWGVVAGVNHWYDCSITVSAGNNSGTGSLGSSASSWNYVCATDGVFAHSTSYTNTNSGTPMPPASLQGGAAGTCVQ